MANHSLIRGWLECSFDDVENIQGLVSQHWSTAGDYHVATDSAELYKSGWKFPQFALNWTSLIFFGADVKEASVDFIFDCLF